MKLEIFAMVFLFHLFLGAGTLLTRKLKAQLCFTVKVLCSLIIAFG